MSDGGTALKVVGLAASMYTGNPWFYTAAALASNVLFPTDKPDIYGPRESNLNQQTASYGVPIPIVYGADRLAGNLMWSGGIKEVSHEHTIDGGLFGSDQTYYTYTYEASFAIGICEGEINGINRIWADGKLIWEASEIDPAVTIVIYNGTETQNPDSIIEGVEGVGEAPAYRGLAYVVFDTFQLADSGNRIPNFEFETCGELNECQTTTDMTWDSVNSDATFTNDSARVYVQDGLPPYTFTLATSGYEFKKNGDTTLETIYNYADISAVFGCDDLTVNVIDYCTDTDSGVVNTPFSSLSFDSGVSPETITQGGSAIIGISGGKPPYTYTLVDATGKYSLSPSSLVTIISGTSNTSITIYADSDSCGAVGLSVSDQCTTIQYSGVRNIDSGGFEVVYRTWYGSVSSNCTYTTTIGDKNYTSRWKWCNPAAQNCPSGCTGSHDQTVVYGPSSNQLSNPLYTGFSTTTPLPGSPCTDAGTHLRACWVTDLEVSLWVCS